MDKYFFTYNSIHHTISRVATEIIASGFEPDIILAVGGGGFIPARILRTYINKPVITVTVSYYDNDKIPQSIPIKLQWLDYNTINIAGKKILLVDEVDDSRVTLEYCLNELLILNPNEIAVFVLHSKEKGKKGRFPAQINRIFVGELLADKWINYPWDAIDIYDHEQYAKQTRPTN